MWIQLLLMAALPVLRLFATASALEPPTFSNEVVRILQTRCQTCHRPGEHAPFSLLTCRDAYEKRGDMRDAVKGCVMPPWKPVPGFGDFVEPRRLSDAELTTLVRWVEVGAPEGDPAKLPSPLLFPAGWRLGPPDHVLEMAETYTVPARASDVYRCFVIPLCAQAVARRLVARSARGAIVNLASSAAYRRSPRGTHYVASKAGVVGLTRALALELAPHGIRVNAIAPGLTDIAQSRDGHSEAELQAMARQVPLGRMGEPADVAAVAAFLASADARHVTGQVIHVNGGAYLG